MYEYDCVSFLWSLHVASSVHNIAGSYVAPAHKMRIYEVWNDTSINQALVLPNYIRIILHNISCIRSRGTYNRWRCFKNINSNWSERV